MWKENYESPENNQGKRQEFLRVAAQHSAYDVRIFGFVIRGDDNETSDIDFLVKLERGRSLLDHAALVVDMEDLLGTQVDIVTETGLKERIRKHVLEEAVQL